MNPSNEPAAPNPFQSPGGTDPAIEIHPEVVRKSPSTWPTALGIVGIAFGIFGAMGGVMGLVVNLFMIGGEGFFADALRGGAEGAESMEVALKYAGVNAAMSTVAVCIALWLLVAGILILQRRPSARMVTIGWAMAKTMLVLVLSGMQIFIQRDTLASLQNEAPGLENMGAVIWVIAIVSAVFNLAWGLALPVFLLFWFSRAKIKAEMAVWQ